MSKIHIRTQVVVEQTVDRESAYNDTDSEGNVRPMTIEEIRDVEENSWLDNLMIAAEGDSDNLQVEVIVTEVND